MNDKKLIDKFHPLIIGIVLAVAGSTPLLVMILLLKFGWHAQ